MSIYRKNAQGDIKKVGGSVIQRWSDRIFQTVHTVEAEADVYNIDVSASKYIVSFTDYTEYQLYISEPNQNTTVYIRFKDQTMQLHRITSEPLVIGALVGKVHCWTLDASTGELFTDTAVEIQLMKADILGKVSKTANENVGGVKEFTSRPMFRLGIMVDNIINANNQKITNLANPTVDGDAVNLGRMTADIGTHNTSSVAHEAIRTTIEVLEREVARLDGRGRSYGEIPYTTAQLQGLDQSTLNTTIYDAIIAGFGGENYITSNGDLVYDEGVGEGVKYHEWEYNDEVGWVDNGAINSPKASNDTFGTVKGNEYVSAVSGLMQILKSDFAERLGASGGDSFTYAQLISYINATVESMKLIQGVDVDTLTPLADTDTVAVASLDAYDLVVAECYNETNYITASQIFTPSAIENGDLVQFISVISNQIVRIGYLTKDEIAGNYIFNNIENGTILRLTGIKLVDTLATNVKTDYDDTNYLDGKLTQDAVNRELDTQVKANADALADVIDGTTKITYDETYTLDEKVAENEERLEAVEPRVLASEIVISEHENRIDELEGIARKKDGSTATLTGTDVLHFGSDVANVPVTVKSEGLLLNAPQLVANGDTFTSGFVTNTSSTITLSNGILTVTATSTSPTVGIYSPNIKTVGIKYLNVVRIKPIKTSSITLGGIAIVTPNMTPNVWQIISNIVVTAENDTRRALFYQSLNIGETYELDFYYAFNISTLQTNKTYSPIYATTFDLMTDAQIKAQMDAWVLDGTLPHGVNPLSVDMDKRYRSVGKNLFDNLNLIGGIYFNVNSGATLSNAIYSRSTTFIPVSPSTNYRFWAVGTSAKDSAVVYYDKNYNYISGSHQNIPRTLATPANCYFVRVSGETVIFQSQPQLELGTVATSYEPYRSTDMYIDTGGKRGYQVPNMVKDEIIERNGKYFAVQRVQRYVLRSGDFFSYNTAESNIDRILITRANLTGIYTQHSGTTQYKMRIPNFTAYQGTAGGANDAQNVGQYIDTTSYGSNYIYLIVAKGAYADISAVRTALAGTVIYYQLATPIETPVNIIGNVLAYPRGTVYIDPIVQRVAKYTTNITVTKPIQALDEILRLNADGTTTSLAISSATIAVDGLSFTHTGLSANDFVWFSYRYTDTDNMSGLTTVYYYEAMEDLRFPATAIAQPASGRPDFDATNIGYLFPQNNTNEVLYIIAQMPHDRIDDSPIYPHVHVRLAGANQPVFKIDYKWYNPSQEAIPASFTTYTMNVSTATWTTGTISSMIYGSAPISGVGKTESSMLICKIYRDDNVYVGDILFDEFDIHYFRKG